MILPRQALLLRLLPLLLCLLTFLVGSHPMLEAADSGSYLLAPNDVVDIKVFQEDDLTSKLRISPRGTVTFPLIGVITIGGMTPQDAANAIRRALDKDYLVNPQVSVTVLDYGKRRYTVLGQVSKAGSYDMPERESVTLLDAIAMAGGYTRVADPSRITVRRKGDGKESVFRLNAKTMARDDRVLNFQVEPGDIITVAESIF
jgi:protein involved in polysaccharide export with SLBB domain